MSQRQKKARLDRSDDDYYSDQEIPVHESYRDDLSVSSGSSPHGERDDTGEKLKSAVCDLNYLSCTF